MQVLSQFGHSLSFCACSVFGDPIVSTTYGAVHRQDSPCSLSFKGDFDGEGLAAHDRCAKVRRLRPYDLRHIFASVLIAADKNPLYIARQIDHHSAWASRLIRAGT
jgi:integrase